MAKREEGDEVGELEETSGLPFPIFAIKIKGYYCQQKIMAMGLTRERRNSVGIIGNPLRSAC